MRPKGKSFCLRAVDFPSSNYFDAWGHRQALIRVFQFLASQVLPSLNSVLSLFKRGLNERTLNLKWYWVLRRKEWGWWRRRRLWNLGVKFVPSHFEKLSSLRFRSNEQIETSRDFNKLHANNGAGDQGRFIDERGCYIGIRYYLWRRCLPKYNRTLFTKYIAIFSWWTDSVGISRN